MSSLTSLPYGTRILTLASIGGSVLLMLLRLAKEKNISAIFGGNKDSTLAYPWLVLVPGQVIYYPWTIVTSSFVEGNIVELLISLFTLPLAGRYLERVYGQAEFLKFSLAVIIGSNVIAVIVNYLESFILGDSALFLYGMSYHGLMGLQVGFLVAFTQLIPEHQVQMFGIAKVRVKSLPMAYVTVSNIACLLGYQSPYILIQFGWLGSYLYLRFIKYNEGGDFRGDRSDVFSFKNWFPSFLQKYVAILSSFVFNLAVRLRIIASWEDSMNELERGGNGHVLGGNASNGRIEAERRRAMALQALDQRASTKGASTPPPANKASVISPPHQPVPAVVPAGALAAESKPQ